jgi:hypothetical protein
MGCVAGAAEAELELLSEEEVVLALLPPELHPA